ncbi:MAG TPA: sulfatase-like hydrolase/transferase [Acidimicrobiales bacterium]|nr:sulfatase-like hydrolase/transferase [Acidimicrobiales bacterium]
MPLRFRRTTGGGEGHREPDQGSPDGNPNVSPQTGQTHRPEPPEGARHLVMVVLDSLRYDTCMAAGMANMQRLGAVQRRWSYASWTAPSHYNLMMGLLPHASPTRVYASEYYKADFLRYQERLGVDGIEFKSLLPSIYLPTYLRGTLGYRTAAMVSMPVLNPHVPLNRDFDSYRLMPHHNDLAAMVEELRFDGDRPWFYLLNTGETHYPYALPGEDPAEWPRISGVHGVVKGLDGAGGGEEGAPGGDFFEPEQMEQLRARQQRAAAYVDGVLGRLFDAAPPGTWIIVTSDHGELFGEGGMFGHGPVAHEKVFEVPFVEGTLR